MTYQDPTKVLEQQKQLAELFKEAETKPKLRGINLVDKAIMKTYVDEDDKGSETNWSVYSEGDQANPVSGEVILETDGDLNESQKFESLPDEEEDENN